MIELFAPTQLQTKKQGEAMVAPTELRMEKAKISPTEFRLLTSLYLQRYKASIWFSKEAKYGDWKQFHPASEISKESSEKPEDDESHEGI